MRAFCYITKIALVMLIILVLTQAQQTRKSTRIPGTVDDCALFKSNDTIALTRGKSSYIEIGEVDVIDGFSLSMEVLPSPLNHNGILFSVGSRPSFEYYEWKTAAVHTQFIVVEFIFSALALTVKAEGTEHLRQIEVFKTYPKPYRIDNANWHTVKGCQTEAGGHLIIERPTINNQKSHDDIVCHVK